MRSIEAWETEDGEMVVVGTHDRIAGLIAAQLALERDIRFTTTNVHWAGIKSRKIHVRIDWLDCDENDDIWAAEGELFIPGLIFEETPGEACW